MKRRTFFKGLAGLTGVGLLTSLYASQVEPFWLEFVEVALPIKNLPKALDGKTLVQISDIHISKRFNHHFIIDSFKKAQQYVPDFVVYTGDFVSADRDEVDFVKLEKTFRHIVKGKLCTVGIFGNHDYGRHWNKPKVAEKIRRILTEKGITILRNEEKEFAGLNIIGLDDYWGLNFNPQLAFKNYDKTKSSIVLCHNPDVCDLDVWNGYEGWILAGHTHGGQCKPPFLSPPKLPVENKTYTAGKFELTGNRTLYINRALGYSRQVRFNVRPEITIFKLEVAKA